MARGANWSEVSLIGSLFVFSWLGGLTAVSYGDAGWPSQSYRLFVFEAE